MRTERFVIRSGSKLTANVKVLAEAGIAYCFVPHVTGRPLLPIPCYVQAVLINYWLVQST
jgi:hypothetical protein